MDYVFHAMFSVCCSVVFMMYPRANVSAKRIRRVLKTESIIENHPDASKKDREKSIVFDDVTFAYPDGEEAVLQHISLRRKRRDGSIYRKHRFRKEYVDQADPEIL